MENCGRGVPQIKEGPNPTGASPARGSPLGMRSLVAVGLGMVVVLGAACGGSRGSGFGSEDEETGGHSSSGGSSVKGSSGSSGGGSGGTGSGVGSLVGDGGMSAAPLGCPPCSTENVNLAGSTCDSDCSGSTSPPASCDTGLAVNGPAAAFAQAIGVCQMADATHWGLVSATYTRGYNSTTAPADGQHAILPAFGSVITPREGANLGVLSSGYALPCDDSSSSTSCSASGTGDPYFKGIQEPMYKGQGSAPPNYPKSTATCQVDPTVYDTIGVTLQIKVPANAQGLSFDFDFYSGEWPEYVCTEFNDSFVAWLQSTAWAGNSGDLNISFDSMNNPVNVNNGFFDRVRRIRRRAAPPPSVALERAAAAAPHRRPPARVGRPSCKAPASTTWARTAAARPRRAAAPQAGSRPRRP